MDLPDQIASAENQFKHLLEDFFISSYNERSLPSHGINHHRRVWNYARELIRFYPCNSAVNITNIPSRLIIACYMHDIGMSVDHGIRHGRYGRDLCLRFLEENDLDPSNFYDVLDAVENHDRKDYNESNDDYLLTILSAADDLDAFGFTGIYRYTEIYLARNNDQARLGHLVKENALKRYKHLMTTFDPEHEFITGQRKRYEILDNFFDEYNKQVSRYKFGAKRPHGFCGVVELLGDISGRKMDPLEFFAEPVQYRYDKIMSWFVQGLRSELSCLI